MITRTCLAAACYVLLFIFAQGSQAQTQSADKPVRAALVDLENWLRDDPNAAGWRRYLKLDALHVELARADRADRQAITQLRTRLERPHAGLQLPRFVQLRNALLAWEQQLTPAPADLAATAETALTRIQPPGEPEVERARAEVVLATRQLDQFLRLGGQQVEQGWKRLLLWNRLQQQLQPGVTPDIEALQSVAARFERDWPGMELQEFQRVRRALRRYVDTAQFAANPRAEELVREQLTLLANDLRAFAELPADDAARLIGRRLGFLERTGQAPTLVADVRRQFSRPNLIVEVQRELIAAGIERDVNETMPVSQYIAGNPVQGTAHTTGRIGVRLAPSADRAVINAEMLGATHAETVALAGPVNVLGQSVTQLYGLKSIVLDASGFSTLPASSSATTNSTIVDILVNQHGLIGRFIERAAWRRASQQVPIAEQTASETARARLNQRLDSEAAQTVRDANYMYRSRFRDPMLRRGQFPQILQFSTAPEAMRIVALQSSPHHLGATTTPPGLVGNYPLTVRVHQTLVENFAAALLAGETLTEEGLQKQLTELLGEVPESLQPRPDMEPWSITFADPDPILVSFADGMLRVTINGRQYTSGDQTFGAMNVSAVYRAEKIPGAARLTRVGDIEIVPPGYMPGQKLSTSQVALRRLLQRRFELIFEPEVVTEGLEMRGRWAELGRLPLAELVSLEGWLTLGWTLPARGN